MADKYVQLIGLPAVVDKLNGIGDLRTSLRKPLRESLDLLHKVQTTYPPKRPNQKYVRTFKLQRSWQTTNDAGGIGGRVRSNRPDYNKWVQNFPTQAGVHRGRWNNTIQQTGQNKQAEVIRIFNAHLEKLVR
jgi:hypothetical protein